MVFFLILWGFLFLLYSHFDHFGRHGGHHCTLDFSSEREQCREFVSLLSCSSTKQVCTTTSIISDWTQTPVKKVWMIIIIIWKAIWSSKTPSCFAEDLYRRMDGWMDKQQGSISRACAFNCYEPGNLGEVEKETSSACFPSVYWQVFYIFFFNLAKTSDLLIVSSPSDGFYSYLLEAKILGICMLFIFCTGCVESNQIKTT